MQSPHYGLNIQREFEDLQFAFDFQNSFFVFRLTVRIGLLVIIETPLVNKLNAMLATAWSIVGEPTII